MTETLDRADIQGLVARGYGNLPFASFLLLTIDDVAAARRLLARWAGGVTSADATPAREATNLAFTAAGLSVLLDTPELPGGFSHPFLVGMADPYRSRFLGDLNGEDPRHWRWGGPSTDAVHVLVLLYDRDAAGHDARVAEWAGETAGNGLRLLTRLSTTELAEREAFGFRDSVSQPQIAGMSRAPRDQDTVRTGEIVLGYRNEHDQYTERPLLPAAADPGCLLPRAQDGAADLGRNGTYLVLRQLRQDVEGFWRFVDEATRGPDGTTDPHRREALAARLVGRWPSGAPLVLAPDHDDPDRAGANDFGYHTEDPDGHACPLGAHIRRVNPRDSLEPDPGSAESRRLNRRHRLLRRGRGYDEGGEQGIHFMCLNANLSRQFEFVQHTWVNNPSFNGLRAEPDPLVGARCAGDVFTEQAYPLRRRHHDLPRFVTVQGGAYFFLPGRSALRYLTSGAPNGKRNP